MIDSGANYTLPVLGKNLSTLFNGLYVHRLMVDFYSSRKGIPGKVTDIEPETIYQVQL